MEIRFALPHVFSQTSSSEDNAYALAALMNCLVRLDVAYLRSHPGVPGLYRAGVTYGRTIVWDTTPALYIKQFGDCKSLAASLVAEYLVGHDPNGRNGARISPRQAKPVFRWRTNEQGTKDFHILVQTESGFEDPSKVLGMGKNENAPYGG